MEGVELQAVHLESKIEGEDEDTASDAPPFIEEDDEIDGYFRSHHDPQPNHLHHDPIRIRSPPRIISPTTTTNHDRPRLAPPPPPRLSGSHFSSGGTTKQSAGSHLSSGSTTKQSSGGGKLPSARIVELAPSPPPPLLHTMDSASRDSLQGVGEDVAAEQPLIKPSSFWPRARANSGPDSSSNSGAAPLPLASVHSQPIVCVQQSLAAHNRAPPLRNASVSDPPPTSLPRMIDAIFTPRVLQSNVFSNVQYPTPTAQPIFGHNATSVHSMPSNLRSIVKRAFSADSGLPFVPEAAEDKHGLGVCSWLMSHGRIMILLILSGTIMSITGCAITATVETLFRLRDAFVGLTSNYAVQLVSYVSFGVIVSQLAVFSAEFLDPTDDCQGSGLPLLKYILSGEVMEEPERHLTPRTLLAKVIGLTLAVGSGLSIGQEGPHVHMAAIISWLLMKHCKCFGEIFRYPSLRRQILDAACAVGVSTTFMAPIGGVLFSIEVTTNYFEISNYWKCFLAAIAGFLVTRAMLIARGRHQISLLVAEPLANPDSALQLPMYVFIGVLLGLMGALYVKLKVVVANGFTYFNDTTTAERHKKYLLAFLVAFLSALALFAPGPLTRRPMAVSISELFSQDSVGISPALTFVVVRFIASIVDTNIRIPSGDFMPLFCIGAGMGRLIGEILKKGVPGWQVDPASYSMVGAAALSGAATQTISSAVICMELTGNLTQQLPIFIAVLTAYVVSRGFSASIYDAMMRGRYLRYLPSVRNDTMYMLTAEDLMEKDLTCITLVSTYEQLVHILRSKPFRAFPVVTGDREFLGVIKRRSLLSHLRRVFKDKLVMDHLYLLLPQDFTPPQPYTEGPGSLKPLRWHNIHKQFPRVLSSTSLCQLGPMHPGTEEEQKRDLCHLLAMEVDLRCTHDLPVDPSPFRVSELCGLSEVYALFDLIRCSSVFVVSYGVLVGVISRRILINNLKKVQ